MSGCESRCWTGAYGFDPCSATHGKWEWGGNRTHEARGELVTLPSPRSLSADLNPPWQRRKRASRSRGRSTSRGDETQESLHIDTSTIIAVDILPALFATVLHMEHGAGQTRRDRVSRIRKRLEEPRGTREFSSPGACYFLIFACGSSRLGMGTQISLLSRSVTLFLSSVDT